MARPRVQVRFTPTGRARFLDIIRYLRSDNPAAAHKFKENAKRTLKRLARFPNSGRSLPEFPDLPHREVIVKPGFAQREGKGSDPRWQRDEMLATSFVSREGSDPISLRCAKPLNRIDSSIV
ncbi:MAG: hypothetical protein DMG14_10900 [Acidobacteria bacterium]|nr:MAG: hypothetical protein DMG14_10900 [Acidobacteriota bacterium]